MERVTENAIETAIRTAYLGYAVATFGVDGMTMVHELPRFAVIECNHGLLVMASGSENAKLKLAKALELFADHEDVTITFEGQRFTPSAYRMAA